MVSFKERLKNWFYKAKTMFSGAEWVVVALIALALIGLEGYNIHSKHKSENPPEVAQVYEPSIGEPLPPDTPAQDKTQPSGPSTKVTALVPPKGSFSEAVPTAKPESKVAPKTGVDMNKSVVVSVNSLDKNSTLENLHDQLILSPDVKAITSITFEGKPALRLAMINGSVATVFIRDNKSYYVYGQTL